MLVRCKGAYRLVLSIDLIQRSVAVEVDARDVTLIAETAELSRAEMQVSLGAIRVGMTQHSLA